MNRLSISSKQEVYTLQKCPNISINSVGLGDETSGGLSSTSIEHKFLGRNKVCCRSQKGFDRVNIVIRLTVEK